MKILVTGGRGYSDRTRFIRVLDEYLQQVTQIICGGARGADALAVEYATKRKIPIVVYRAEWDKYSNQAGPMRNQRMLDAAHPDLIIAFPGGKGTLDMVRRGNKAAVDMLYIDWLPPVDFN